MNYESPLLDDEVTTQKTYRLNGGGHFYCSTLLISLGLFSFFTLLMLYKVLIAGEWGADALGGALLFIVGGLWSWYHYNTAIRAIVVEENGTITFTGRKRSWTVQAKDISLIRASSFMSPIEIEVPEGSFSIYNIFGVPTIDNIEGFIADVRRLHPGVEVSV